MKYRYASCRVPEFFRLAQDLLERKVRAHTRMSGVVVHIRIPQYDMKKLPEDPRNSTLVQSDFYEKESWVFGIPVDKWTKLTEEWLSTYEVIER